MTADDRKLASIAFAGGPSALVESGIPPAHVKKFLSRADVRQYIDALTDELPVHEGLMARQRFLANRQLSRLTPQAVQIMADALRGIVYEYDEAGNVKMEEKTVGKGKNMHTIKVPVIKSAPPAEFQIEAAQDILDRMGINDNLNVERGQSVSVSVLFNEVQNNVAQIDYGGKHLSEQEKIAKREKIREVMAVLSAKLPGALNVIKKRQSKRLKKIKKITCKVKENGNGESGNPSASPSGTAGGKSETGTQGKGTAQDQGSGAGGNGHAHLSADWDGHEGGNGSATAED